MSDETPGASAVTDSGGRVTREVEVEAATDEVWSALAEPDLRALWLDDDDARSRELRLDEVDDGHRLVWTWWRPEDEAAASTVEIVLAPTAGGTRVTVTETLAATRLGVAEASATRPGVAEASARPGPATLRAGDLWSYRVLGLELLFVAAGVLVR